MYLRELLFNDYYHQFLVIEADTLTERCSKYVKVKEDDCFALCSNYVAQDGHLCFQVLSIGNDWQNYKKGLRRKDVLAIFDVWEVLDKQVEIITPTAQMVKKNNNFMNTVEKDVDLEKLFTRVDPRMDMIRDFINPDYVQVGLMTNKGIQEFFMEAECFNGPFLEGHLVEQPDASLKLKVNDKIRALPYIVDGYVRLISIFVGDKLSEEEEMALKQFIKDGDTYGFGFAIPTIKN